MSVPDMPPCRFCGSTDREHGDDCRKCGCPRCGFPGALALFGFCPDDCGWEAAPGAYKLWAARQPKRTQHQKRRRFLAYVNPDSLPPDDAVGRPIFTTRQESDK